MSRTTEHSGSRMSAGDLGVVELEPDGAGGRVVSLVRVLARRRHHLVPVRPERQPEWLHLRCGSRGEHPVDTINAQGMCVYCNRVHHEVRKLRTNTQWTYVLDAPHSCLGCT